MLKKCIFYVILPIYETIHHSISLSFYYRICVNLCNGAPHPSFLEFQCFRRATRRFAPRGVRGNSGGHKSRHQLILGTINRRVNGCSITLFSMQ